MKEKQFKVVLSPIMARYLVKNSFRITDLKPHKDNPLQTVFVFENSEELHQAMKDFQDNMKLKETETANK